VPHIEAARGNAAVTATISLTCDTAVTTSEAMPAYAVIAPSGRPIADPSIAVDQRPQPHPGSAAALSNSSAGGGAATDGPPRPPTDVTAIRRADGSVLVRWTPPGDRATDHFTVQYRYRAFETGAKILQTEIGSEAKPLRPVLTPRPTIRPRDRNFCPPDRKTKFWR